MKKGLKQMNDRKSFYDIATFYKNKAKLDASYQGMRYRVEQGEEAEDKVLLAAVWPEPFCFDKTPEEKKKSRFFPFTEEGLDEAYEWICAQYTSREKEWQEAKTMTFIV